MQQRFRVCTTSTDAVPAVQVVNIPVVQQRQFQQLMLCRRSRRFTDSVPTVKTVQKTEEISQVRFLGKVVDIPVVVQHQVSMVQVVQKTAWKKSTGGQLQDELQGECKQLQLSADSSRKQITMCS